MKGPRAQRGGFGVGLIVGLLIGLTLALGVALYVTKAPIPFVNKVPQRTAGQDAAETEKNKNWDPNSPLYGKNPARPSSSASGAVATPPPLTTPPVAPPAVVTAPLIAAPSPAPVTTPAATPQQATPTARTPAPAGSRDPAAILADRPATRAPAAAAGTSTTGSAAGTDPFTYFVQVGAYAHPEDADQQRARLAIIGMEGRITERDQSGRIVFRVRVGPFELKTDADAAKEKLVAAGVEAQLVRVQR